MVASANAQQQFFVCFFVTVAFQWYRFNCRDSETHIFASICKSISCQLVLRSYWTNADQYDCWFDHILVSYLCSSQIFSTLEQNIVCTAYLRLWQSSASADLDGQYVLTPTFYNPLLPSVSLLLIFPFSFMQILLLWLVTKFIQSCLWFRWFLMRLRTYAWQWPTKKWHSVKDIVPISIICFICESRMF